MAITTTSGTVHRVTFLTGPPTRGGCAWVGSSPSDAEIFYLLTYDNEPAPVRQHKLSMLGALATALGDQVTVAVYHDSSTAEIVHIVLIGPELG
jgi:hypothetical protein